MPSFAIPATTPARMTTAQFQRHRATLRQFQLELRATDALISPTARIQACGSIMRALYAYLDAHA